MRSFKPQLQRLETRQLMAGDIDFGHLADQLELRMNRIDSGVNAVQTAAKLPVVGEMFSGQQEIVDLDGGVSGEIADALRLLPGNASATAIRSAVATRLQQIGYLGDHNGDNATDENDVVVTVNHATHDVEIETRLTKRAAASNPRALDFDLGLDAVPLSLSSGGELRLQVGVDYEHFKFGLNNGVFQFDTSREGELRINLLAQLQNNTLHGRMGFLEFSASQQDAPNAPPTQLDASLVVDVTDTGMQWEIEGTADVHLDLYAGITGMSETAPSVATDLDFHWDFSNFNSQTGIHAVSQAPTLQLNNIRLRLGQVLTDVVKPWLGEVQKVTAPLQPIVDVLTAPIPGLSDLSRLVGQGDITLIDLARQWGDFTSGEAVHWPNSIAKTQQQSVSLLETAATVVEVVDIINRLPMDAKNLEIVLGSYEVIGNTGALHTAAPAIAERATQAIGSELGIRALEEFDVYDTLDSIVDQHQQGARELQDAAVSINAGYNLQTPMFTGKPWAMMLLGRESDLIRFDAEASIAIDKKIPFVNFFGLGVGLQTQLNFNAMFGVGFDTRGFLDNNLLQGVYVDTNSRIELGGEATLYAGLDVVIASAEVHGGLSTGGAPITLTINDLNQDGKLRPDELKQMSAKELFQLNGALAVEASLRAEIGVNTPFGFLGASKEYVFAEHTILDLTRDVANGDPWRQPANPNLAYKTTSGELVLNVGAHGPARNVHGQAIDEFYRIEQIKGTGNDASIRVSAFGASEEFEGIRRIVGDAGTGNDRILIDESVLTGVELSGGDGNDSLESRGRGAVTLRGGAGNDRLTVTSADASLYGDAGDDTLKLGQGGRNFAFGGEGNDTLYSGPTSSNLFGGEGDDLMIAGEGTDRLYGGNGDDVIELAGGEATVFAGAGTNRVIWETTDGNARVDAVGNTTVEVVGTPVEDEVVISGSPATSQQYVGTMTVDATKSNRQLEISLLTSGFESEEELASANGRGVQTHLRFEGGQSADRVEVGDMAGSGLTTFAANLTQMVDPDHAPDEITLFGTKSDDFVVVDQQEYFAWVEEDRNNPEGGQLHGPSIIGGVTSVRGLRDYQAFIANDGDVLNLDLGEGNDVVEVAGTTGRTNVLAGEGDDRLQVVANRATDLLGGVQFHGDGGRTDIRADFVGFSHRVEFGVDDRSIVGAMVDVDADGFETHYPVELTYSHVGGTLGDVVLQTGNGDDELTLGSNREASSILVHSGGGDDQVSIGRHLFGAASTQGYTVFAGGGSDTLNATAHNNEWSVEGRSEVTLNGMSVHGVEVLHGGDLIDRFAFRDGIEFTGKIDGGAGPNTLDYSDWSGDVIVDLEHGAASNVNGFRNGGVRNVDRFIGGRGNDLFIGNANANDARGGDGRDVLFGGLGADTLDGGAGEDLLFAESYQRMGDRSHMEAILRKWAATANPSQMKGLIDSVFLSDDNELDTLFSDRTDWLF